MSPKKLTSIECPSCGEQMVYLLEEDVRLDSGDVGFLVRDAEYWQCANCGEQMYGYAAMRKIESVSPAFQKHVKRKKAA